MDGTAGTSTAAVVAGHRMQDKCFLRIERQRSVGDVAMARGLRIWPFLPNVLGRNADACDLVIVLAS